MLYEGKFIPAKVLRGYGVSDNTINSGLSKNRERNGRGSWAHIYDPGDQRQALIEYDTIPSQTIRKYNIPSKQYFLDQAKAADKAEQQWKQSAVEVERNELPNAIAKDDAVIRSWYLDRLSSIRMKNPKLWRRCVNDYTRLSLWMQFVAGADKSTAKRYNFNSLPDFYEFCCKCIKQENLHNFNIGVREPGDTGAWKTYQVFMRRLKPFSDWLESAASGNFSEEAKRAALESLVSKKFGVANNLKRSAWHINQLIKFARYGNQLNAKMMCDDLNTLAKERNMDEVSHETVRLWLRDKEISNKLFLAQKGYMSWLNRKMFIINREGASVPDALWWGDGTPTELWWYDAKTRQLRRENYNWVMDDYSTKIIGLSVGNESHDAVYRAVKNAVENKGTVAWQFQTDNGPGYKGTVIEDFFETIFGGGYGHTPAKKGLARTKLIEPYFAQFRQQILARFLNHSFGNITSAGPQANPDFVKAHLDEFPKSPEELHAQVMRAVEVWNEMEHKNSTRNELYDTEYDDRRYISELWFADKFYLSRKEAATYREYGIKFTWAKQDHFFIAPCPINQDTPEQDLAKVAQFLNENADRRFDIKWNPDDLSKIALYYNGAFYAFAYNKKFTKRALYDTTQEDNQLLRKYWRVQELQEQDIKDYYSANDEFVAAENLAKAPFSLAATHKNDRAKADTKIKEMHVGGRSMEVEVYNNEDRKTRWGA